MTDFKPIEIQDKPLFDEFLAKDPPEISELTFTNLFVWRQHYQTKWLERNGCILVVFHPPKAPAYGLCPFGPGDKKTCLDVLCQELAKETADVRVCRVGQDFVANHADPAKFEILPDQDNSDYVYLSKDLINLSGNKYHRKKNHLNQFIKNHAFEYRRLDAALVKLVLGMQTAWCRVRECVEKPELLAEDFAVHEALAHFGELEYQGGAVLINSAVEAFSLGELLNQDTAVIHIEKANPDILGLYAAINQLFCLNAWSKVTYINREQDMGVEGLRKAKESYYPHHRVNKYTLIPR
ncbi:MAG: DUF2156 domain-containing protein [Deltaproteobacteria bacterium]